MFPRAILRDLKTWAASDTRKPLVLRGARQVGKTSVVRLLAETTFEHFVHLDLDLEEDARFFRRGLSVEDIYQALRLSRGLGKDDGRTLVFLDEVQGCPEAIALLRQFKERMPDLCVVAAGSLLEVVLARGDVSFPVGRVEQRTMSPLSFREFLVALGEDAAVEVLDEVPLPDHALEPLFDHFHRYALVGGMPEIVARYAESRDVPGLSRLYDSLLTSYLDDVGKYARNPTMEQVLRHAIEAAPYEAGRRIRFAGFGRSSYRSREMGEALRLLERAMLVRLLYPTTSTTPPLLPDRRKSPRLQFLDTGLLNYFAGLQEHHFAHDDLHGFHQGTVAKHIVGQELIARESSVLRKPTFWVREKRQSTAEVDFLVQHGGAAVPVEVKAGKTGTLRSLHQFMDRSPHDVAVRLHRGRLGVETATTPAGKVFRLLDLPYFLAARVPEYLGWMNG